MKRIRRPNRAGAGPHSLQDFAPARLLQREFSSKTGRFASKSSWFGSDRAAIAICNTNRGAGVAQCATRGKSTGEQGRCATLGGVICICCTDRVAKTGKWCATPTGVAHSAGERVRPDSLELGSQRGELNQLQVVRKLGERSQSPEAEMLQRFGGGQVAQEALDLRGQS